MIHDTHPITRRSAIGTLAAALSAASFPAVANDDDKPRSGLGIVAYCTRIRRESLRRTNDGFDLYEPANFLEHCRKLGAGGMQCPLGILDRAAAEQLRATAERHGLYIEAIVRPPQEKKDVERFTAEMQTAAAVGAIAARTTIIPGRRYEFFDSLAMFKQYEARGRRSVELAAPVAEQLRLPLAIENHKDHRDDQRLALFEHISSEYVGACVDTGNSFALLEDPIETVEKFAPWAHSVHLKDQALQLDDDGFLLGDIPLGQGGLDLRSMVQILKKAKPAIRFSLELITRDPLKVPCLTEQYWSTLPDVPGSDLARTLRYVRQHATDNLQYISKMTSEQQLAREDANIRESLDYARNRLAI